MITENNRTLAVLESASQIDAIKSSLTKHLGAIDSKLKDLVERGNIIGAEESGRIKAKIELKLINVTDLIDDLELEDEKEIDYYHFKSLYHQVKACYFKCMGMEKEAAIQQRLSGTYATRRDKAYQANTKTVEAEPIYTVKETYLKLREACRLADKNKDVRTQVHLREQMALCLHSLKPHSEASQLYALAAMLMLVKKYDCATLPEFARVGKTLVSVLNTPFGYGYPEKTLLSNRLLTLLKDLDSQKKASFLDRVLSYSEIGFIRTAVVAEMKKISASFLFIKLNTIPVEIPVSADASLEEVAITNILKNAFSYYEKDQYYEFIMEITKKYTKKRRVLDVSDFKRFVNLLLNQDCSRELVGYLLSSIAKVIFCDKIEGHRLNYNHFLLDYGQHDHLSKSALYTVINTLEEYDSNDIQSNVRKEDALIEMQSSKELINIAKINIAIIRTLTGDETEKPVIKKLLKEVRDILNQTYHQDAFSTLELRTQLDKIEELFWLISGDEGNEIEFDHEEMALKIEEYKQNEIDSLSFETHFWPMLPPELKKNIYEYVLEEKSNVDVLLNLSQVSKSIKNSMRDSLRASLGTGMLLLKKAVD